MSSSSSGVDASVSQEVVNDPNHNQEKSEVGEGSGSDVSSRFAFGNDVVRNKDNVSEGNKISDKEYESEDDPLFALRPLLTSKSAPPPKRGETRAKTDKEKSHKRQRESSSDPEYQPSTPKKKKVLKKKSITKQIEQDDGSSSDEAESGDENDEDPQVGHSAIFSRKIYVGFKNVLREVRLKREKVVLRCLTLFLPCRMKLPLEKLQVEWRL